MRVCVYTTFLLLTRCRLDYNYSITITAIMKALMRAMMCPSVGSHFCYGSYATTYCVRTCMGRI